MRERLYAAAQPDGGKQLGRHDRMREGQEPLGDADGAGMADGGMARAGDGIFEVKWGRWVDLDDCVVQELARRSGEDLGAVLAAGFGGEGGLGRLLSRWECVGFL